MQKKKVTCKTAAVKRHEWSLVHSKTFHQNVKKNCGLFLIVTKALEKQKQFQAKVFCDSSNRLVVLFCIIGLISYKCTIRVTTPPPPSPLPAPSTAATALLLDLDAPDWTEIELSRRIPTSGLYLMLTVIWMQLMVSSRSTKTGLFWVWALSALDSEGVVFWRLTATAGTVCQIVMWHTKLG